MSSLKNYSKPALTFEEQIKLLKDRGLCFENEDYALNFFRNVNYYHLEGYWFSFYDRTKEDHQFYPNISFSQIAQVFEFDNDLRTLVFDAISRIEISFRTRFIYELAMEFGAFPFKKENFEFKTESAWGRSYQKLLDDLEHSKEDYIKHYKETYKEELPPIWIMGELMTFGELSTWYDNYFKSPIRKRISLFYGLQPDVLTSWLRVFSLIRNICAHHGRLWNKPLPFEIMIPKKLSIPSYRDLFVPKESENMNSKRIFNPLLAMQYMLDVIHLDEPKTLLKDFANIIEKHGITNTRRMGVQDELDKIMNSIMYEYQN